MERMKEGYSKIRNEALAHAFVYMNMIEHLGSGIPRIIDKVKAAGLPDWIGLLTYFAQKVKRDQFAFQYYENKVKEMDNVDKLPEIAGYIEKDFNEEWFKNSHEIRTESQEVQDAVANGVSPFKAEIAEYISSLSVVKSEYKDEVKKLLKIIFLGLLLRIMTAFLKNYLKDIKLL